jgi:DNA-binding CsgD family transcriptional regulator
MSGSHETCKGTCFFCEAGWEGLSQLFDLSKREVEILQCLILDDSVSEAAAFLGISERTVRTHLQRIHTKLNVHSRSALMLHLVDMHLDWFCESSPPPGCRLNVRLVRMEKRGTMRVANQ